MADFLMYDDLFQFDEDIDHSEHSQYEDNHDSRRRSYSSDCLSNISYDHEDVLEGFPCSYNENPWSLRDSTSTLETRLMNFMAKEDPEGFGAVQGPMSLEDIRSQFNSCKSCGVSWSENHVSLDCKECGGYSLTRPCPRCDGKCLASWTRDVSTSHSLGKAEWAGKCNLPVEKIPSIKNFLAEDVLIQGIEDLCAS